MARCRIRSVRPRILPSGVEYVPSVPGFSRPRILPVLVMRFEATTPGLLAQYQREVEEVVERSKQQAQLADSH